MTKGDIKLLADMLAYDADILVQHGLRREAHKASARDHSAFLPAR